jgi:hypothetical protein
MLNNHYDGTASASQWGYPVTWWRKRTTERDALRRALTGIKVRTEIESAVSEMRRAFEKLEMALAIVPGEDITSDGE